MSKLKSLYENNAENIAKYNNFNNTKPIKNGIGCPVCANELFDTNPDITLTSNPPQKDIYCQYCDYRGYRIA